MEEGRRNGGESKRSIGEEKWSKKGVEREEVKKRERRGGEKRKGRKGGSKIEKQTIVYNYVPGGLSSMKMVALASLATPTLGDSTTVNCSMLSRTSSSSTVILMSRSVSLG